MNGENMKRVYDALAGIGDLAVMILVGVLTLLVLKVVGKLHIILRMRLWLAKRLLDKGCARRALEMTTRLLLLLDNSDGRLGADILLVRGEAFIELGDHARAQKVVSEAIQEYLLVALEPLFHRGNAHYSADFTAALEIKPDYALALNNRGYVYIEKAEWDKAIADFTAALKIEPDFTMAQKTSTVRKGGKNELHLLQILGQVPRAWERGQPPRKI
ncbi:MAG: tetratricopeptide repeat protein [Treponematales bacterium]